MKFAGPEYPSGDRAQQKTGHFERKQLQELTLSDRILRRYCKLAAQSHVAEQAAVTASPEPSVQTAEQAAAEISGEFRGKVIKVVDGDRIDALSNHNQAIRIRLNGIDGPQRGQPLGNSATEMLKASMLGSVGKVISYDDDCYDRTTGDIHHDGTLVTVPTRPTLSLYCQRWLRPAASRPG